jgi:16S rRNA (cytidine1402-2'-O)-methyltransferase
VATPIGHLGDLSPRAAHLLRTCDLIACEDTRVTRGLLTHLGSHRPLVSYHDHREEQQAGHLIEKLQAGQSVALVSDAGTPNISDPGFRVVRACRRAGVPVVPIPGPSALLAALCASGLPTHGFLFAGFLPPKSAARRRFLARHKDLEYTLILYESCHRIAAFAEDIVTELGPTRIVAVAREVTKKFETFLLGPAGELPARLSGDNLRGEFTVLIAPADYSL